MVRTVDTGSRRVDRIGGTSGKEPTCLEKEMATHSSTLAWRIPWTEEPGGLQSMEPKKNPPASAGDVGDTGSIPGSGRSPGGGRDSPLRYSYLENPMDKGAWWATDHRVAKS